ncbi:hypothetical protein B0T19DRAFT_289071 [Cercophora scortea]|uniref:Uncharacterized protein n=1 Tax=Cercophora scortea TaxID=314031 RepID=A0AAE0I333_9PEZI|nr:hypothetical protein B0T19DRAFT_289071 [Cercophora scortea]
MSCRPFCRRSCACHVPHLCPLQSRRSVKMVTRSFCLFWKELHHSCPWTYPFDLLALAHEIFPQGVSLPLTHWLSVSDEARPCPRPNLWQLAAAPTSIDTRRRAWCKFLADLRHQRVSQGSRRVLASPPDGFPTMPGSRALAAPSLGRRLIRFGGGRNAHTFPVSPSSRPSLGHRTHHVLLLLRIFIPRGAAVETTPSSATVPLPLSSRAQPRSFASKPSRLREVWKDRTQAQARNSQSRRC